VTTTEPERSVVNEQTYAPDWRTVITYASPGPEPYLLVDEPELRVLVAGLEPGGRIPPHPERRAVYHALEGEGFLFLDGTAMPFRAGAIIVAPEGSTRGIEAVTRLAFMAVRIGPDPMGGP
jgi:quercetin dioxygenase-like cupin family protein